MLPVSMRRPRVALLALLALLDARARADAPPDAAPITLARAQALAEERAPDVLVALARDATAHADVEVAGIYPDPQLGVGTTSGTALLYASLYVTLPLFGQLDTAVDAARAQASVADADVDVARLDARFAASIAWWTLWQASRELEIALDNGARRERLLEIAEARFAEGAAPRLDVLRARAAARLAAAEAASLRERRRGGAAALSVLLGQADGATELPPDAPTMAAIALDDDRLHALVDEHPVVVRARRLVRTADALVTREHRARWPLIGAQVGGSFFERQPPPTHDVSVTLTFDVPIFDEPRITRAETARREAAVELEAVAAGVTAQLTSARADALAALRRRDAIQADVVPAATEAADLALEAYESGGLDLTSALVAEQTRTDAVAALVAATGELGRARAALEHAAGRSL